MNCTFITRGGVDSADDGEAVNSLNVEPHQVPSSFRDDRLEPVEMVNLSWVTERE